MAEVTSSSLVGSTSQIYEFAGKKYEVGKYDESSAVPCAATWSRPDKVSTSSRWQSST
jgi:hypothetical protein